MFAQPTTDPIISRLRPRSVTEILDQAFRLYRRYFLTFLAITAVVFVPVNMAVQLLSVAMQGSSAALQRSTSSGSSARISETLNQQIALLFVLLFVFLGLAILGGLLQYLSQGALTSAVADSHLDRPVSFGRAYRTMFKHIGPLVGTIGLQILIGIGIFLPAIAVFLMGIAALTAGGDTAATSGFLFVCFAFLLMFVTIIFYAYVFVRLTVVVPAVMVENLGPVQAVRRSWQLVQGYWWRTLAVMLVLAVLNGVISAGPAYLVAGLVTLFTRSLDPVVTGAITAVVSVIMEALVIPLSLTCYTLYYFDLRVRKEGFDLETALNQRYSYPGGAPSPQGYAPAGTYAGQYAQYGQAVGYSPPQLGYTSQAQPQYPSYPQQGYTHPQQAYTQPQPHSQPGAPSSGAPIPLATSETPVTGTGANTSKSPTEHVPGIEGLGFTTPSISEQAAQPPTSGSQPHVEPTYRADTSETGKLEPPRPDGDGPTTERER